MNDPVKSPFKSFKGLDESRWDPIIEDGLLSTHTHSRDIYCTTALAKSNEEKERTHTLWSLPSFSSHMVFLLAGTVPLPYIFSLFSPLSLFPRREHTLLCFPRERERER